MARQTLNIGVCAETMSELIAKMNEVNKEYGSRVFATQTHVTALDDGVHYTAIFFVTAETQ